MTAFSFDRQLFAHELEAELIEHIYPFWLKWLPDPVNGGFHGAISNDLHIHDDEPRAANLCSRTLWTFSAAYRQFGSTQYREMAEAAYDYLTTVFWDKEYGGLYWSVDRHGIPIMNRKHHYAQAFAIYGLSEYYRAVALPEAKALAQQLFELLEKHAYDPVYGGYIEGSSREWHALEDMRLSDRELNSPKSMNTLLHILEAYTNLLRIWDDAHLRTQHQYLLNIFQEHVFNPETGHLKLFFDPQWTSLVEHSSYGHDIEASWLLWEAAQMHDDPALHRQIREITLHLAESTYREGLDTDGSIFYEGSPQGIVDDNKAHWPQAEGMVGFYNAYRLSGQHHFLEATLKLWQFIQQKMTDRTYGDWFKQLDHTGKPDPTRFKAGIWDCPYHHSRACLELIDRMTPEEFGRTP